MNKTGLNNYISRLEQENELLRIKEYVNPILEIAEITDRISKQKDGGKALLFENTGTEFPLLINSLGSTKRICLALGINNFNDIEIRIDNLINDFMPSGKGIVDKIKLLPKLKNITLWLPKKLSKKGICQQVVNDNPDLNKFPILKCWPFDGGNFITLPLVHSVNPVNGIRNVGMYRMQVLSKNETGMHWHRHKGGAHHFNEYKKLGKKMPIAVILGGDPVYTYVATAPLPDDIDEYLFAGFLRNKRVDLVRCISQDLYVPYDADIVIEGYVDPNEDYINEGPFGDHTGFYSLKDKYPKFHVTCITHKKDAVYPATIVGIPPQEDAYIAKATERIFLIPIKKTIAPEIIDMILPVEGVAHNLAIVKIQKKYPAHAIKIANSLWGAGQMMFTKVIIIVDQYCNINNYDLLIGYIVENVKSKYDIYFTRGPMDELDHTSLTQVIGGKLCIDATKKLPEEYTKIEDTQSNKVKSPDIEKIKSIHSSYQDNISLKSHKKYPIYFIGVDENNFNVETYINIIQEKISTLESNSFFYFILVDKSISLDNYSILTWFCLNNFNPENDIHNINFANIQVYIFDCTSKYNTKNHIDKDWPNIIVSSDDTIKKIDELWEKLDIGHLIQSPSLIYNENVKSWGASIRKQTNN